MACRGALSGAPPRVLASSGRPAHADAASLSFEVASDGLAEAGSEGRNVQGIDLTFYRAGGLGPDAEGLEEAFAETRAQGVRRDT